MQDNIHPKYFSAKVVCAGRGCKFEVGSVVPEINISICSNCHPFYTKTEKIVDREGRVDKFKARYAKFAAPAAPAK